MQLPKYRPVEKKVLRYCRYMDCNREFYGRPIQKYCDFHTDPHHRKRIRPKPESPEVRNQVFKHGFSDKTVVAFGCALPGCKEEFAVEVVPRQYVYPKFCEKHRNEFKRKNFERLKAMNAKKADWGLQAVEENAMAA